MSDERTKYLEGLADEYGIGVDIVYACAELLGEDEDYDGLICACQDAEAMGVF